MVLSEGYTLYSETNLKSKIRYETPTYRYISYEGLIKDVPKGQIEVILKRSGKVLSHFTVNKVFNRDELKKFASFYESKQSK